MGRCCGIASCFLVTSGSLLGLLLCPACQAHICGLESVCTTKPWATSTKAQYYVRTLCNMVPAVTAAAETTCYSMWVLNPVYVVTAYSTQQYKLFLQFAASHAHQQHSRLLWCNAHICTYSLCCLLLLLLCLDWFGCPPACPLPTVPGDGAFLPQSPKLASGSWEGWAPAWSGAVAGLSDTASL